MSLTSGARLIRHRWTPLPMPADAIQRVTQMGRQQHMPSTITFADRHGNEIADPVLHDLDHYSYASDDDSTYTAASSDSGYSDNFDDLSAHNHSGDDADEADAGDYPDAAPEFAHDDILFPHSDPDDASASSSSSSSDTSSLSAAHTPPALAPLAAITPAGGDSAADGDSVTSHENTGVDSSLPTDDEPYDHTPSDTES